MKLSILIPTLNSRIDRFFPSIIKTLNVQIGRRNDIQVLGLLDNKTMTIGEKRNKLLSMATGEFIVYIDDDDRVSPDYIQQVMQSINENPDADCIVYHCICKVGNTEYYCRYGIEYEYTKLEPWSVQNTSVRKKQDWYGKPAHTMVYRASLVKDEMFPHANAGEDFDWVARCWPKVKKQVKIEKVLYYYDVVLNKKY